MKKIFIPLVLVLAALIFFGAAGAGAIPGLNSEYVSGETITIIITNSEETGILATLEANEFDLNKENLNFIRSYGATSKENNGKTTWTLNIDTTGVPLGTYNLIIQGNSKVLASDKVKIVSKKSEVIKTEPIVQKEQIIEEKSEETKAPLPTATSPGFGFIALLGLLAVYIKRK